MTGDPRGIPFGSGAQAKTYAKNREEEEEEEEPRREAPPLSEHTGGPSLQRSAAAAGADYKPVCVCVCRLRRL